MAIRPFLAMTAAEMRKNSALPPNVAWMACHFSPYGTGLSNLPRQLPPGALLMVDDITPIHGHDPELVAAQLTSCVEALDCPAVLLDFQRPGIEETSALVKHLSQALPCPVVVSELYGQSGGTSPVLLSPVPPSAPPEEHLQPWQGREIWLELALDGEQITLTEQGADVIPLPFGREFNGGFAEESLHCHYRIEMLDKEARFTLWRTPEDLDHLLEHAEALGIKAAVGLYQELDGFINPGLLLGKIP